MKITNIQTGISVNGHGSSYFKLKTQLIKELDEKVVSNSLGRSTFIVDKDAKPFTSNSSTSSFRKKLNERM